MAEFTTIPDTLRRAADLWLAVRRAEMAKASYRVVPAKVERFLHVVGEVQTDRLDAKTWGLWVRSLKMDVREGKLRFQTARIAYSRSREFLRSLINHGMLSTFPVLDESAEKAHEGTREPGETKMKIGIHPRWTTTRSTYDGSE